MWCKDCSIRLAHFRTLFLLRASKGNARNALGADRGQTCKSGLRWIEAMLRCKNQPASVSVSIPPACLHCVYTGAADIHLNHRKSAKRNNIPVFFMCVVGIYYIWECSCDGGLKIFIKSFFQCQMK